MTTKELNRINILSKVLNKELSQVIAAKQMGVTERHMRRLVKEFKSHGNKSIISKKRGKKGNRCLPQDFKRNVLHIVNKYYQDFGPTLASEYLFKNHNIKISVETLRRWMIEINLWVSRSKGKKIYPPRQRRLKFGELIQIDGSHHDWFEGRSPPCVLMVFIDDATSAITSLHFSETENLEAYYKALEKQIINYGIPLSVYGDRCSVLTPRVPSFKKDSTQFQKALKELNCKLVLASSPQAKGKVERANRTLQDRLVKELRIKGISTIEEGNLFLEEFRKTYNKTFSKKPNEPVNAHRPLDGICLENVLCTRETRTLNKDNVLQFQNKHYLIKAQDKRTYLFKGAKIEIRTLSDEKRQAFLNGSKVDMILLGEVEVPIVNEKEMLVWKTKKKYIPPKNHPYKRNYNASCEQKLIKVI